MGGVDTTLAMHAMFASVSGNCTSLKLPFGLEARLATVLWWSVLPNNPRVSSSRVAIAWPWGLLLTLR
jgi:hypothetical protein